MSGDLVSLKMIAIASAPDDLDAWRQAAGMSSVPIEFSAHKASMGSTALANSGVEICLIDSQLPAEQLATLIASARHNSRGR